MKKYRTIILRVGIIGFLIVLSLPLAVRALSAPDMQAPAGLSIEEIKMTGDEFVVLQNNSGADIADLSSYALYYFNNYNPFAKDVSSSTTFLPATSLAGGDSILLSGDPRQTCGATVAGDLGISLGDSSGFLEIVQLSNDNGVVTQQAGDAVSWSSTANGIIQSVPTSTKDPAATYYRYQNETNYSWQYADIDASNPCQLNAIIVSGTTKTPVATDGTLAGPSDDVVPGVIVSTAATVTSGGTSAYLPAADIGLKSPKLSEILPDPKTPATDADNEFIELYNPNIKAFDLTGFTLQVGSTTSDTRHNYVFPTGSTIPANGFKAFYSKQTHLSLSNTGGQAWLLDPFGTSLSQTDPYAKPKEGSAWATANGKWYYTTTPTPDKVNSIKAATSTSAKTASSKAKTTKGTPITAVAASAGVAGANSASFTNDDQPTSPIHPLTLAVVIGLALLYGAYEYRHDLASRFHKFRTNRAPRP